MIHVALDLTNIAFTDSQKRYVAADSASLVSSYRRNRFTFIVLVGSRRVVIDHTMVRNDASSQPRPAFSNQAVSGFTYLTGVRYDLNAWAHFNLTAGQDLGFSAYQNGANYSHYVRLDAEFNVI